MNQYIEVLKQWAESPNRNFQSLRDALGELLKEANEASFILKAGIRNPTPEIIQKAQQIIGNITQFEELKTVLPQVDNGLQGLSGEGSRTDWGQQQQHNAKALRYVVHTLANSYFSPAQIAQLQTVAQMDPSRPSGEFPEEADPEGFRNHIKNSIYNAKSPQERTLKAIREILQNAVDATDPRRHVAVFAKRVNSTNPEIHISTHPWGNYMDIVVHDNGIGMNWNVLSQKFYVIFQSGKRGEAGAAGGFGIAKGLFQEEPQHGWSVETKHEDEPATLHSSRFHKNVYFASRQGAYTSPTSQINKDSEGGTTLSLYALPPADNWAIERLCSVYATNGRVKIYLNDKFVEPKFTLEAATPVNDIGDIAGILADNESQKQTIKSTAGGFAETLQGKMDDLEMLTQGKSKIKFYVRKTPAGHGGRLYVMLNGQYQFDRDVYANKVDIICSIETTARPGEDDYPLDPGRENVRGKENDLIDGVVNTIQEFTNKVGEDDLFKAGIDAITINEDQKPMKTVEDDEDEGSMHRANLERAITNNLSGTFEKGPEEQMQAIQQAAQETGEEMSPVQQAVLGALIKNFDTDDRIEQKERLKTIIEGVTTPANIMIQKNFVARDFVSNPEYIKNVAEMIILWQKSLKFILNELANSKRFRPTSHEFVPGIIYSDEALAVYIPAKNQRKYDTIALNAITLAAMVQPKLFYEKLTANVEAEAFETIQEDNSDTPINRVASFLYHEGVHELTHMLYPDGWGHENFHRYISKMEQMCEHAFARIKDEVKRYMKGLRKGATALINQIAKSKKRKLGESFRLFQEWLKNTRPQMLSDVAWKPPRAPLRLLRRLEGNHM